MTKDETLLGLYMAQNKLVEFETEGGDVPENAYKALEGSMRSVIELIAMESANEQDRRLIS